MNGWGNTDWPEEIWQPTWDIEGGGGVLLSYLRYGRAEELDKLIEEDRIKHVIDRWSNVFPGLQDHIEFSTSHAWADEMWSSGAWASPTPDQDTTLKAHIGKSEGFIHFAGEHASEYHGWMQGALSSGLRAAKGINEK